MLFTDERWGILCGPGIMLLIRAVSSVAYLPAVIHGTKEMKRCHSLQCLGSRLIESVSRGEDTLEQMTRPDKLDAVARDYLKRWATKYIWWKTAGEALRMPERIIAQVMNIGDYDDVQEMVRTLGDEALCDVLRSAEAGMFNERSWVYWHYRLGLAAPGHVPPLPARRLP